MAIKKSSQLASKNIDTNLSVSDDQIKSFISNADKISKNTDELDPDAIRNYKQLSIRFNEYEYKLLEKYSKKVRRSIADSMRDALIEKIKTELYEIQ